MTSTKPLTTPVSHTLPSPLGDITLELEGDALVRLSIHDGPAVSTESAPEHSLLAQIVEQLMEYFNGQRQDFDVPVALEGTAFQQDIWQPFWIFPTVTH